MIEYLDLYVEAGFCFFSILFFMIAYREDTFSIKTEQSWDKLRLQYKQQFQDVEADKLHFPNEIATFCYNIQSNVSELQWEYVYFILLSDIIVLIYIFVCEDTRFWGFAISLVTGSLTTFILGYYISSVTVGTIIKVPVRADPNRWAYGNGLFISLFCIGVSLLMTQLVVIFNQYVFKEQFTIAYMLGCVISVYYRREQQSIMGRGIEIAGDLLVKDNIGNAEVQGRMMYNEKLAQVIGPVLSDTHIIDMMMVFMLYFTIPKMTKISEKQTNYYSVVLIINFLMQFIISFLISFIQHQDAATHAQQNTRLQIILSTICSVISLTLLVGYDTQLMSIATFGLIMSALLTIYIEYVTNHSFPQVRKISIAALNAPTLNILTAHQIGNMAQGFIVVLVGLMTIIAREIDGIEGIYALLTGVLVNSLVQMSVHFSGIGIQIGLKCAQVALMDCTKLNRASLAASNNSVYIKTTTIVSIFLLSVILLPIQQLHVVSFALGLCLTYFNKGFTIRLVKKVAENACWDDELLLSKKAQYQWSIATSMLMV